MKNIFLFLILAFSLSSCVWGVKGDGNVVTRERKVSTFEQVDVSGAFTVYLKQGSSHGVTIEADENLHPIIITEVEGNTLKIYADEPIRKAKKMAVYVNFPEISSLDISGACEIFSKSVLKGAKLKLDFSGASEAELQLDYQKLMIDGSGASEMELSGSVEEVRMELSGASDIDAEELKVIDMYLSTSGASDVDVNVTGMLEVHSSGASEVEYVGNPQLKVDKSGASSVSSKN